MEPQRVPIMTPSSGVKPMVVSMHLPSSMAHREAPEPMWHTTTLRASPLVISATFLEM